MSADDADELVEVVDQDKVAKEWGEWYKERLPMLWTEFCLQRMHWLPRKKIKKSEFEEATDKREKAAANAPDEDITKLREQVEFMGRSSLLIAACFRISENPFDDAHKQFPPGYLDMIKATTIIEGSPKCEPAAASGQSSSSTDRVCEKTDDSHTGHCGKQ